MNLVNLEQMLHAIAIDYQLTASATGLSAPSAAVLAALRQVPREEFVLPEMRAYAHADNALPIACGQTISQPFIVALMTDLLQLQPGQRVLEIGTGSGYQAAVLACLVEQVFSLEIVPELADTARQRLRDLGYANIRMQIGDGYHGWPEQAPFDAIIVTAAADHVPEPLLQQLRSNGRMVIPVGCPSRHQVLRLIEKDDGGKLTSRDILDVSFVPLVGEHQPTSDTESSPAP
jgi:protein-L-isoaspartate(D-aspartate) O-methyltransferase